MSPTRSSPTPAGGSASARATLGVGPAIDHGFLRDGRDAGVIRDAVEALRGIVASEPVARLVAGEERPGDEGLDAHLRENVRGIFHPVATCALGSVVDADGAVHGLEGLFVVDASVFPTIPRANTNLSVVAVAELLAERLSAR